MFFLPEENPCRQCVPVERKMQLSLLHSLPETIAPEGVTYRFCFTFHYYRYVALPTFHCIYEAVNRLFEAYSHPNVDHTTVLLQENPVQLVG